MTREDRINIYRDTINKALIDKKYEVDGKEIIIKEPSKSVFISKRISVDLEPFKEYKDASIEVENEDCLVAAKKLVDEGLHPAVLNLASWKAPGGGVLNGARAQEENIFRRTNLFQTLYPFHSRFSKMFDIEESKHQYPLNIRWGAIYSPSVSVFKGKDSDNYPLLKEPYNISVITCAALSNPKLIQDSYGDLIFTRSDMIVTLDKIRQILSLGIINGNDSIVLGAFGCGAFKNPPKEMAKLFHVVMEERPYKNKFKKIVFAILDDHNSNGKHNPNGNFKPFYDEFKIK